MTKAESDSGRYLTLLHQAVTLIRDEILMCQNSDCRCRQGYGVCNQCREAAQAWLESVANTGVVPNKENTGDEQA